MTLTMVGIVNEMKGGHAIVNTTLARNRASLINTENRNRGLNGM